MKKSSIKIQNTKIVLVLLLLGTLAGCKKNTSTEPSLKPPVGNQTQKAEKLKELAREILSLAKNNQFTQLVYDQCKLQKFGDYYVRIQDLLEIPNSNNYFSAEKQKTIAGLLSDLKTLKANNPIIFYPSVETREEKPKAKNSQRMETGETEFL